MAKLGLSCGFFEKFFDQEDMVGVTPILQVMSPIENSILTLTDGRKMSDCFYSNLSGEKLDLPLNSRVKITAFHRIKRARKKSGLAIDRLEVFADENLPPSAMVEAPAPFAPPSFRSAGTGTDSSLIDERKIVEKLPDLLNRVHCWRLCEQSKFVIGKIGTYFQKVPDSLISQEAPSKRKVSEIVSKLTGLSDDTVRQIPFHDKSLLPTCHAGRKKRLTKRELWMRSVGKLENIVQAKIRQTIHSHYKHEIPVKVEGLIEEVKRDLAHDHIEFHLSKTEMRNVLRGMGNLFDEKKI